MRAKIFLSRLLSLAVILVLLNPRTIAQTNQNTAADQNLYKEIACMDSVLFNSFNTRDIEQFKTFFAEDLEFYHDKGGLTNYDHTIEFLKSTAKQNNQLRRELVKSSLEVYPIPGYGAMEIGEHIFCHIENGKKECGTFKFIHVWQKKNETWKISRVISYGH